MPPPCLTHHCYTARMLLMEVKKSSGLHFSAIEHLKNTIKVMSIKKKTLLSVLVNKLQQYFFLVYFCVIVELHFRVTYPSTHHGGLCIGLFSDVQFMCLHVQTCHRSYLKFKD